MQVSTEKMSSPAASYFQVQLTNRLSKSLQHLQNTRNLTNWVNEILAFIVKVENIQK